MSNYQGPNPNFENSNVWQSLTCDGAIKAVPIELDWSLQDVFVCDLLYAQQQGFLPGLGTLWVNNNRAENAAGAATAANVRIRIDGTTQDMTVRAGSEGYYPVLAPTPPRLTFTGTANAARTQVIFISALLPGVVTSGSP